MTEPAFGAAGGRRARVLFIHDVLRQGAPVAEPLRAAGFEVAEAASGEELEAAAALPVNLVLIDLAADGEGPSGLAGLAAALRRAGLDRLPIVTLGSPRDGNESALPLPVDRALPDPAEWAMLPGVLRELLAGERASRLAPVPSALEERVTALTAENLRLRQGDAAKNDFMQAISHELATPLTPLAGYLKILQSEKLGTLNDKQRRIVDTMIQSSDRLARTIDSLSELATMESGSYRKRVEDVEILKRVQQVVEEVHLATAKPKHVQISQITPSAEVTVTGDSMRLSQAIKYLLENAVARSPHGASVLLEITEAGDRLLFAVYDQGEGVPPEHQERMLEPFHQVHGHQQHLTAPEMTLPVARRIAEAHGGRLTLESPPKEQPEGPRNYTGARLVMEIPVQARS